MAAFPGAAADPVRPRSRVPTGLPRREAWLLAQLCTVTVAPGQGAESPHQNRSVGSPVATRPQDPPHGRGSTLQAPCLLAGAQSHVHCSPKVSCTPTTAAQSKQQPDKAAHGNADRHVRLDHVCHMCMVWRLAACQYACWLAARLGTFSLAWPITIGVQPCRPTTAESTALRVAHQYMQWSSQHKLEKVGLLWHQVMRHA